MPTLEECVNQIQNLVNEKKFNADPFFFKLIWGVIELAEAMDIVKKTGLQFEPAETAMMAGHLAEEVIDIVFYACDAYRLLRRRYPFLLTMDKMFEFKMQKNMNRTEKYGAGILGSFMKTYIDHMAEEGLLFQFLDDIQRYGTQKLLEWKEMDKHPPLPPLGASEYGTSPSVRKCEKCGLVMKKKELNRATNKIPSYWVCPNGHTCSD